MIQDQKITLVGSGSALLTSVAGEEIIPTALKTAGNLILKMSLYVSAICSITIVDVNNVSSTHYLNASETFSTELGEALIKSIKIVESDITYKYTFGYEKIA